jgi:hypothetical protein
MSGNKVSAHAATVSFTRARVSALDTHEEFLRLRAKAASSPILPANITGQQFSKMDDPNGALAISVPPRKPSSTGPSFSKLKTQTG